MRSRGLSLNEQIILGGLVRHPTLNDRELAEALDFKLSTFTAVKNRLRTQGKYINARVPLWGAMGCEIMVCSTFHFDPLEPRMVGQMPKVQERMDFPEFIYVVSESVHGFSIGMARRYTDIANQIQHLEHSHAVSGSLPGGEYRHDLYPIQLTRFHLYFDFEPVFREVLAPEALDALDTGAGKLGKRGVRASYHPNIDASGSNPLDSLTEKEKSILRGLIEMPDLPYNHVASKLGVSRQTIGRLSKEFESRGLFRTARFPDIKCLGAEILGLFEARLDPGKDLKKREELCRGIADSQPGFVLAQSGTQLMGLFLFKNFDACQRMRSMASMMDRKHGVFQGEPSMTLFSIPNTFIFIHHRYVPLVSMILESR